MGEEAIWIVHGSTGEYSDRGEWVVYAFRSEEEARAYVEFLGEKRQQIGSANPDYDERETIAEQMLAFDPNYSEDYTGTHWFIRKVAFKSPESSPPESSAKGTCFECSGELHGPFCPACNLEMVSGGWRPDREQIAQALAASRACVPLRYDKSDAEFFGEVADAILALAPAEARSQQPALLAAARAVVEATEQDDHGRWFITGDAEELIAELATASDYTPPKAEAEHG